MVKQKTENLFTVVQFYPKAFFIKIREYSLMVKYRFCISKMSVRFWLFPKLFFTRYGVKASMFVLGAESVRSSRTISILLCINLNLIIDYKKIF
jgi:hypothetical protein